MRDDGQTKETTRSERGARDNCFVYKLVGDLIATGRCFNYFAVVSVGSQDISVRGYRECKRVVDGTVLFYSVPRVSRGRAFERVRNGGDAVFGICRQQQW